MRMTPTIIVVEDDPDLGSYLHTFLTENRMLVQVATRGIPALDLIDKVIPNLVILDLNLPDISGESLCTQMKDKHPEMPVIMLTAKDDVQSVVNGLNLGADDYMTKPFSAEVLLARIKAKLRQSTGAPILRAQDLTMNTETMEVSRAKTLIPLTHTEFTLLRYLLANKNRVLTREMILNHVWDYSPDIESRVVDVYIGYLRKKIDKNQKKKLITSVRGFGYTIKE